MSSAQSPNNSNTSQSQTQTDMQLPKRNLTMKEKNSNDSKINLSNSIDDFNAKSQLDGNKERLLSDADKES